MVENPWLVDTRPMLEVVIAPDGYHCGGQGILLKELFMFKELRERLEGLLGRLDALRGSL